MLNHITVIGRLTADPELRKTQNNISVASFTVAVDRDFQQGGNRQTDFFRCVAWRNTAEFVSKYFRKGSMAVVAGKMESRKWESKGGEKHTDWEIQVEDIYFGESKKAPDVSVEGFEELEDDEDLPF